LNELALFAGAGGGILGGKLLGWRTVCAVEFEPSAASVLLQRQNDGILPPFPIWDDVRTFDGKPWRGTVDVVSGGFPCQDISAAGKGKGLEGQRSGLWGEMARIVREVRPRYVFVENSPVLTSRGLGRVLGDLAEMGYDARWGVLGAGHLGAPHQRDRIWVLADSDKDRQFTLPKPEGQLFKMPQLWESFGTAIDADKLEANGAVYGKNNVLAGDVDRIAAIGNGQVPAVAAFAWKVLARV
jgi:DNA (cytosine-5)-methyltransferase 1